jgi:hypothetical protein
VNRTDALVDVRRNLHERLIGRVDARQLDAMPRAERRVRVREEALSLLREQGHMLPQSALADVVNAQFRMRSSGWVRSSSCSRTPRSPR